jgi:hypothetical protein
MPPEKDSVNGPLILAHSGIIIARSGEKDLAIQRLTLATRLPRKVNRSQLKLHPFWDPLAAIRVSRRSLIRSRQKGIYRPSNDRKTGRAMARLHVPERAKRTAVRNSSSSNGFMKKADAPALKAVERTSVSSFPVKIITRVEGEISRSRD